MLADNPAFAIFSLLITAGLLAYIKELVVWLAKRRKENTSSGKILTSLAETNRTIAILRAARDDLQNENDTLRATLKDERDYHTQARAEWRVREHELLLQVCYNCRYRVASTVEPR